MSALATKSTHDPMKFFEEILSSARYVVDAGGGKTDIMLSLAAWEHFLAFIEDLDDRLIVKDWLPRLQAGPEASGALSWENVAGDWDDDDETVSYTHRTDCS